MPPQTQLESTFQVFRASICFLFALLQVELFKIQKRIQLVAKELKLQLNTLYFILKTLLTSKTLGSGIQTSFLKDSLHYQTLMAIEQSCVNLTFSLYILITIWMSFSTNLKISIKKNRDVKGYVDQNQGDKFTNKKQSIQKLRRIAQKREGLPPSI
ncbi:unnamed protein product (macronuclear) [Paramecium tetraurelia]|uniref:Transmembrane protein n=1 Tax=Paramecium tetraurelia TaxID=5888 RepID=A0BJI6_PARTE|nr:uncharacterized protein GSPATT00029331001 [Paramecium tetraurelia]CAK58703.1 unnamed protein product [Paramecium tetraurelia]|eukprot:XP_001426101.1 hypothetical protein (macronuclear) [Paramecium tetraurelia strain d4-2]